MLPVKNKNKNMEFSFVLGRRSLSFTKLGMVIEEARTILACLHIRRTVSPLGGTENT